MGNCRKDVSLLAFLRVKGSGDMSAFWKDWKRDLLNRRTGAMWVFATLAAAISGPMGSYENCTFEHRLLLWGLWIGLFAVIATGVRAFVHAVLDLRDFHRGGLLTAVLVACGVAFPVNAMNVMAVLPVQDGPYLNAGLPEIVAMVFIVSLAIAAHHHFGWGAEVAVGAGAGAVPAPAVAPPRPSPDSMGAEAGGGGDPTTEVAPALPRIVLRLEPGLRGPLVALTVRDHYVDVQTQAGRGTLLMRLSDAMEEVEPVAGAQVHRSHWVAWDQVRRAERNGTRIVLLMTAGPAVPVSRAHHDRLAERGLI